MFLLCGPVHCKVLYSTVMHEKQYVGEEGDGKGGTKGNRLGVGRRKGGRRAEMTQIGHGEGVERNKKDQRSRRREEVGGNRKMEGAKMAEWKEDEEGDARGRG